MTIEKNNVWLEMEKKYLPHKQHDGQPLLEVDFGNDKVISFNSVLLHRLCTCANLRLSIRHKSQMNQQDAWKDYIDLCKRGGSMSFLG